MHFGIDCLPFIDYVIHRMVFLIPEKLPLVVPAGTTIGSLTTRSGTEITYVTVKTDGSNKYVIISNADELPGLKSKGSSTIFWYLCLILMFVSYICTQPILSFFFLLIIFLLVTFEFFLLLFDVFVLCLI